MDLKELAHKVFESFEYLKRILANKACCSDDEIVIFDDPIQIVIKKDSITFFVNGIEEGIVTRDKIFLSDKIKNEAIMWLESLSSLKFRRYSLKRKIS